MACYVERNQLCIWRKPARQKIFVYLMLIEGISCYNIPLYWKSSGIRYRIGLNINTAYMLYKYSYIPKDIYAILYQETLHMWFCVHHNFLSVVKVSNVSRVLCYDAYTYYQMEGSKLWILTIRMQQSCCTKQQQQQKSNILRNGEWNWTSYI